MGRYPVTKRHTDKDPANFNRRKNRLFRAGFDWFYHIREGQRGPFTSREAAAADLAQYLATLRFIEENAASLPDDLDAQEITHIEIEPPPY